MGIIAIAGTEYLARTQQILWHVVFLPSFIEFYKGPTFHLWMKKVILCLFVIGL